MDVLLAWGDSAGDGGGPLFTIDFDSVITIVTALYGEVIGNIDYSSLEHLINQYAVQYEQDQPDGTLIEIDITGWTNPLTGTDYSQSVADQLNGYWSQGKLTVNGETMQAWPGNSQVAWGYQDTGVADTLTIQYVKGIAWFVVLIFVMLLIIIALGILYYVQLKNNASWKLGTSCPSGEYWNGAQCAQQPATGATPTCNNGYHWDGTACVKNPSWFSELPVIEQIGIIAGVALVGVFGLIFAEEYLLAEAGASKSSINIGSGY